MRKRLWKQFLCYLLGVAILASSVQIPAKAAESANGNAGAQVQSAETQATTRAAARTDKTLGFDCNGGAFAEGYQVPDAYPVQKLPDGSDISKPGYAFAGWYEQEDFTGTAVTEVSDADHSGPVVLYAKWTDAYYYIDIPASVAADGSELKISGESEGLYEQESVSVCVRSQNDWNLKNNSAELSYLLKDKATLLPLENDTSVMSLSSSEKSQERVFVCEVTGKPEIAGQYQDTLTFQITHKSNNYTLRYEGNGGSMDDPQNPGYLIDFEEETRAPGSTLDGLPVAIKSGYTFLGWCYDAECTKYVGTADRLLNDTTLYASYTENQPFEAHTIATFARAIDADGASLVIQVTDKSKALTAEQILSACSLKNLSDFTEDVTLVLSAAGNNTYTISKKTGWKEGSNYKLVLDNDDLYFTGFDTTIREYEISIHKDEVRNVSLNPKLKYISVKELSDLTVNGQKAQSVSVATMAVGMDGAITKEGSSTTGSFTYQGSRLKVGDQIAVYAGDVIPAMDDIVSSDDGHTISFFEITAVNGTQYSYRGSKTEDVLFMPDVLPLDLAKDQDGDAGNNSVTVNLEEISFDGSTGANPMISADATVEEGDYLALYRDINDPGTLTYGKITSVLMSDGKYILTYQPQTWDEVRAAMDVYTTEMIEGRDLLADADVEALESNIEAQALSSGFADEVARQIGELTIRTDSFAELEQTLSEELNANVEITSPYSDLRAAPGAMKRVEVGLPQVKADIDTRLRHFEGNESGIHLGLEVSVPITFHVARFADFTITVTATFEQEVRVAINVDGEAVWKTWGIFPYIADYRVTASLDLYEYTGIALDINFKTEQTDNFPLYTTGGNADAQFKKKQKIANNVSNIVSELQDMMEDGREYISDKSPLLVNIQSRGALQEEISVAKSLAERYADLIEDEGDWVEIYTRNIQNKHIRILYVIDIAIELDFVVWANVNVSIGVSFWYKNAKRYVFNLHVKGRKATSDTINIAEEEYEFSAYAMGTIGLKAGVRLTVRVGLISTELASVGLSAEVGGYVQLWGYLYYILKYTASAGRNTRAIGALYLEIGIYLDIKFRAQALANAFTYAPTLFEAMWPIYTAGTRENVLDFADTGDTVCEMKYEMREAGLPEDFFTMNYMDMKEGLDDGEYFTKIYEDDSDKYFVIEMTNDAFSYDPKTNIISVNPGSEKSLDGEMIVTWKNQPGTFNTKPFQKKVKLHWDMLRDGYVIGFISNGGTYVSPIGKRYGGAITKPADPKKQGYAFAGWYLDEELTQPYTIPDVMPDVDTLAYAKWTPVQVEYTVKSYLQGANGLYEVPEDGVETGKAFAGTTVTPTPKVIPGYKVPEPTSIRVNADGSSLVEYTYTRQKYTATFKADDEVVSTGSYRYGTLLPVPAVYKPGYDFAGWIREGNTVTEEVPLEVPANDVTYFASWKPQSGIGYTVRYYVQEESGNSYRLDSIEYLTGETGATVTAPAGAYSTAAYHVKDNAPLPQGVVAADGSLELRVYYDLNTYTVTYNTSAADAVMPDGCAMTFTARPQQKILTQIPTRDGYRFLGWYLDADCKTVFDNTMPSRDITLYAAWERKEVSYVVRHYQENIALLNEYGYPTGEEAGYTLIEEETFFAAPGASVTPAVKAYDGFTAPAAVTKEVTADESGNGTLVIEYKYSRNEYRIEWKIYYASSGDGLSTVVQFLPYGASITQPNTDKETVKQGYRVDGWYEDEELTKAFTHKTMPGYDLVVYPKWVPKNIEYKVTYEFWDGDDLLYQLTDTYTGLADSVIAPPVVKTFEGYTFDEDTRLAEFKINPNWPYVDYRYNINTHTLTYQYETDSGTVTEPVTKKYGENTIRDNPVRDGYAFAGWYTDAGFENLYVDTTMPDRDLTLYGKWEIGMQSYQVVHYLTQQDGTKGNLYLVENLYGMSGTEVTPSSKAPEGFADVPTVTHTLVPGSVANNRIEYVYPRKQYQVTYHLNGGTGTGQDTETLAFEAAISNAASRAGYSFAGWYLDEALQTPLTDAKMPAHDLTLYAGWNAQKSLYKIEHYREDALTGAYRLAEFQYEYAFTDSVVQPEARQYYGYQTPETKSGVVSADPSNCLVIPYYYDCTVHTLTMIDAVSGENAAVGTVTEEKKSGSMIQTQTRKGYLFDGWYKDADYTEKYNAAMPDEDLTLYAKWIPQMSEYQFVYQKQTLNGTYVNEKVVRGTAQVGTFVTPEEVLNIEGHTAPEVKSFEITENANRNVFLVQYSRNRHTVTFKQDNGEGDIIRQGYYGSDITAPVPKKEGYVFVGWSPSVAVTIPDEDVTYTAQWKKRTYLLTFHVDGKITSTAYEYGQKISLPEDPKKEGYLFKEWSGGVPYTMPARDLNLTATWLAWSYLITYNLTGGSMSGNPTSYTYDTPTFTLKQPTKEHYRFAGWSGTGVEGTTLNLQIRENSMGNLYLMANWEDITHTVTYADNGATLGMGVQEIAEAKPTKLWKCTAAPTGYQFVGWSLSKDNPSLAYTDGQLIESIDKDMTLYPMYEPIQYPVRVEYRDQYTYDTYYYDFMSTNKLPVVSVDDTRRHKWGYNLNAWYLDAATGTSMMKLTLPKYDSFTMAYPKPIRLKADWTPNNKYVYTPSDRDRNSYDITDESGREVTFTFYVDGRQTDVPETGDYGLGDGGDYVIHMENISYDVVSKNYSKINIKTAYSLTILHDGYAIMRIKYKPKNGEEVSWTEKSTDLQNAKGITSDKFQLDRTDIEYIKFEFDADGGKIDEYLLWNMKIEFEFE